MNPTGKPSSIIERMNATRRKYQLTWQGLAGFLAGDQEPVAFRNLHDLVQWWTAFNQSADGPLGMISDVFAVPALPATTAVALVQYLLVNGSPLLPANYILYMAPSQVVAWAWKCNQELGTVGYNANPIIPATYLDPGVNYIAVENPSSGESSGFPACIGTLLADFTKLTPVTM